MRRTIPLLLPCGGSFFRRTHSLRSHGSRSNTTLLDHHHHHRDEDDYYSTGTLILVRHGQSQWNVTSKELGTTARFTGWANVDLTSQGRRQAAAAGRALARYLENSRKRTLDCAYTSLLRRSQETMHLVLQECNLVVENHSEETPKRAVHGKVHGGVAPPTLFPQYQIPTVFSWRFNERHYGALVGLSKAGAEQLYGTQQLSTWRNSWHVAPPPMTMEQLQLWKLYEHSQPITIIRDPGSNGNGMAGGRSDEPSAVRQEEPFHAPRDLKIREKHPYHNHHHHDDDGELYDTHDDDTDNDNDDELQMPASESLKDTVKRLVPIWMNGLSPRLQRGETVLVVSHANTIRSLLHLVDPAVVRRDNMKHVKVPSAVPLAYHFRQPAQPNSKKNHFTTEQLLNLLDDDAHEQDLFVKCGRENDRLLLPGNLCVMPPSVGSHPSSPASIALSGQWIKTEETDSLSFCSAHGQAHYEHEIA